MAAENGACEAAERQGGRSCRAADARLGSPDRSGDLDGRAHGHHRHGTVRATRKDFLMGEIVGCTKVCIG